jgi:hypothetical protein
MHPFGSDIDTAQDLFRREARANEGVEHCGKLGRFMHLLVDANMNQVARTIRGSSIQHRCKNPSRPLHVIAPFLLRNSGPRPPIALQRAKTPSRYPRQKDRQILQAAKAGCVPTSLWLQSSMVFLPPHGERALLHLAHSTPVGDRFEPSQNSSRTRGFALVSNAGTLRGRVANEAIRRFRNSGGKKIRGRNNVGRPPWSEGLFKSPIPPINIR